MGDELHTLGTVCLSNSDQRLTHLSNFNHSFPDIMTRDLHTIQDVAELYSAVSRLIRLMRKAEEYSEKSCNNILAGKGPENTDKRKWDEYIRRSESGRQALLELLQEFGIEPMERPKQAAPSRNLYRLVDLVCMNDSLRYLLRYMRKSLECCVRVSNAHDRGLSTRRIDRSWGKYAAFRDDQRREFCHLLYDFGFIQQR